MVKQLDNEKVLPRFERTDGSTIQATGSVVDEWDLIADLDLKEEELTILGYVVNGVRESRIAELTGMNRLAVSEIKRNIIFELAVDRIRSHRNAFLKSDVMGLKIKAMDVIAWYLLVNPDELLYDKEGNLVRDDDGHPLYRFSDRVKSVLYREKRMAAALLVQDHLLADRVTKVQITHQVRGNMEQPTIEVIQDEIKRLSAGGEHRIPTMAELEGAVIDGDFEETIE